MKRLVPEGPVQVVSAVGFTLARCVCGRTFLPHHRRCVFCELAPKGAAVRQAARS